MCFLDMNLSLISTEQQVKETLITSRGITTIEEQSPLLQPSPPEVEGGSRPRSSSGGGGSRFIIPLLSLIFNCRYLYRVFWVGDF